MKNILKKLLMSSVCVALATALMAVGALADGSSSQSQRPEGKQAFGVQGGPGNAKGRQGKMGNDDFLPQIKEQIKALEDEDKQASLTKLLEAYENALEAEKSASKAAASAAQDAREPLRAATTDARDALASALSDAGIDIMNRGGNVDQNNARQKDDGSRKERNGFAFGTLNTEAIKTLIVGLDDSNVRENLTGLLAAYTEAMEAEKAGIHDSSLTDDAKKALRETLTAAADKLTQALKNAGVEQSAYTRRPGNTDSSAAPPEASLGESSAESGTAKTGIFQRLADWLGSWVK